MDRGAWWATVHGVAKSQTQLKWLSMHVWPAKTTLQASLSGGAFLAWRAGWVVLGSGMKESDSGSILLKGWSMPSSCSCLLLAGMQGWWEEVEQLLQTTSGQRVLREAALDSRETSALSEPLCFGILSTEQPYQFHTQCYLPVGKRWEVL